MVRALTALTTLTTLTTLTAVAALAVTAAPASAGLLSSPLGLTTKPKPAVYDHGITQGRLKAAPKQPGAVGARSRTILIDLDASVT